MKNQIYCKTKESAYLVNKQKKLANLTKANKNPSHGLEVKSFITVEH